jgi:hypothetical protein
MSTIGSWSIDLVEELNATTTRTRESADPQLVRMGPAR